MTSLPGFTVDIDQNPYLPAGGRDVSAIVTVTADDTGDAPAAAPAQGGNAEIIIVDCSGSMDYPPTKMTEARAATAAAVDVIRDGTSFAIVAGTSTAWPVYPADGSMAVASERTRTETKAALRQLRASGGTAIGQWLRLAHRVFSSSPATLRHAILLTDGKNQHETPDELAADFEAMMSEAMSKQLPDVLLRVWTPQQAALKFVKQVAPAIDDLTSRRLASGAQAGDYPTGAWAPGESRDYHVAVTVNPANLGQEMLAARVSLVASSAEGQQVLGQGLVRVTWTDDEALSTRINARVAGYTGQAELAAAIADGLEASKRGEEELATARLGRAVALAHQEGNEETARLLASVVDVVDEATGTVRLKKKVDAAAEMALDTRSTKTVRVKKG